MFQQGPRTGGGLPGLAYIAPAIAPKIGPRPAIFKNWIKKIFQVGKGTKSTPSLSRKAGVSLSGLTPNILSINPPYK